MEAGPPVERFHRFVGFLYTLAKLVPVERFTGRRWNGAECLSSANSSVKGTRALRPRGLLRQPASDWRYCGRSPRLSPFVPPRQEKGEFHACTVPRIVR